MCEYVTKTHKKYDVGKVHNHLYIDWKITPELYGYLYITCLLYDCMPKIDPSFTGINICIGLATINYLMFS